MSRPARRLEVTTGDRRTLVAHDGGVPDAGERLALVFHNGSPHTGALLEPLVAAAEPRGIRVVTYARPSYGGSTAQPGRTVAGAAPDVALVADALGIERFAVAGASGGGPHALACAALLPARVPCVATFASPAPFSGEDAWFAGMQSPGALRAAAAGREARARFAQTDVFDEAIFTASDWEALGGDWGVVGRDAGAAEAFGPDGLIDDDVAFTRPWGFALERVTAPVLVVQGEDDRVIPRQHGERLAAALPAAELRLLPGEGHVSVLRLVPDALDWLLAHAG